jgi:GrpB-like predicted nucleotidyltransferase (UPF0157 family)
MSPFSELPKDYDPKRDRIEIAEYDPLWPEMYRREETALRGVLRGFAGLRIEHIGSTAVPGLSAKPILDILISVDSRDDWPGMIGPIEGLGYQHWTAKSDEDSLFFVKGMPPFGPGRTHHAHIYDKERKKELLLRDHLRAHPGDTAKYAALKRDLAAQFATDREAYTDAKTEFIEGMLRKIPNG